MELSILERVMCLDLLPDKGSYSILRSVQEFRMKLIFTDEEVEKYEIKQDQTRLTWNNEGTTYNKDIKLSPSVVSIVRRQLEELDKEEGLTENFLSLYEKFVLVE